MKLGGGPDAPIVSLSDEEIAARWPFDYAGFVKRVRSRLPNIKINNAFHDVVKALKGNQKMVFRRSLDPRNPKSKSYRDYYSDAAVDAIYTVLKGRKDGKPG